MARVICLLLLSLGLFSSCSRTTRNIQKVEVLSLRNVDPETVMIEGLTHGEPIVVVFNEGELPEGCTDRIKINKKYKMYLIDIKDNTSNAELSLRGHYDALYVDGQLVVYQGNEVFLWIDAGKVCRK